MSKRLLVVDDEPNLLRAVAAELNLSVRTVENHVSRILAKKKFTNRVEIACLLLSNQNEA